MKILFDENFPKSLKKYFWKIHEVHTVQQMGWDGKKNGELLKLMLSKEFEVLITADKNLHYQQNLKKYTIIVILIDVRFVRPNLIEPLMPSVLSFLENKPKPGISIIK
ncbi:MAG: hypothetical protein POELPBGB_03808 [Bacteroidia bacterium]|nr:hypothetical protein [Bacteroidia bacterium]